MKMSEIVFYQKRMRRERDFNKEDFSGGEGARSAGTSKSHDKVENSSHRCYGRGGGWGGGETEYDNSES